MAFYNSLKNHHNHNIVISFNSHPAYDFWAFGKGYHDAASTLATAFLAKNGHSDYDGYPIVFLYRHAFETNLKNIIYWTIRLGWFKECDLTDTTIHHDHNLVKLSKLSTSLLFRIYPNDSYIQSLMTRTVDTAIEFHEIDANSYAYRYPIDKKGEYSTSHHQVVNIESIAIHMEKLLDDLEAFNHALAGETDTAQEEYEANHDLF